MSVVDDYPRRAHDRSANRRLVKWVAGTSLHAGRVEYCYDSAFSIRCVRRGCCGLSASCLLPWAAHAIRGGTASSGCAFPD